MEADMVLLHVLTPVGEFVGEGMPGAVEGGVIWLEKPAAVRVTVVSSAIDPRRGETVREMRLLSLDGDYWGERMMIGAGMVVVNQLKPGGDMGKQYQGLRDKAGTPLRVVN